MDVSTSSRQASCSAIVDQHITTPQIFCVLLLSYILMGGIFSCLGVVLVCFLALGVCCYIGCSFVSEKELEVE